jgi:hypothetical protein
MIRMIKSRRMRWVQKVACTGQKMNAHSILVGKPEGKIPLERLRRRWEDNIKDRREAGWGGMDWIGVAQDRNQWLFLVTTVMNLWVL